MPLDESTFGPETSPGYHVRVIHQLSVAAIERALAADGMSATQWMALVQLHFGIADTCVALARGLAHDKGAMTRIIDQMEAAGWVTRERDADDRRLVRLSITDAGREAAIAAKRKVVACWNGFLADWSDTDIADLLAMLKRLRRSIEDADPCVA